MTVPERERPPTDYGVDTWSIPFASAPPTLILNSVASIKDVTFKRKIINRNLSALNKDDLVSVVEELQQLVTELQRSVEQLWNRGVEPSAIARDGLPVHGSACSILRGQYVRITSKGVDQVIAISHGLRRKPIGCIFTIEGDGATKVLINGDASRSPPIPPATNEIVYFITYSTAGKESIGILV